MYMKKLYTASHISQLKEGGNDIEVVRLRGMREKFPRGFSLSLTLTHISSKYTRVEIHKGGGWTLNFHTNVVFFFLCYSLRFEFSSLSLSNTCLLITGNKRGEGKTSKEIKLKSFSTFFLFLFFIQQKYFSIALSSLTSFKKKIGERERM